MAQRYLTAWFTLPGLRQQPAPTQAEAASFDALAPKLGYLSKAEVKRVRAHPQHCTGEPCCAATVNAFDLLFRTRPSVRAANPKFAQICGPLGCELRVQKRH